MSHDHDDFAVEPIRGLPELLPKGEEILWQGQPNWWELAKDALNVRWVAAYFVGFAIWRAVVAGETQPFWEAVRTGSPFLILGAVACGILCIIALIQAKATVYTITNRRVAMRIGAALTMTLNLPYTWIGTASLALRKNGTGTIALNLLGETRLSYLNTWPHVRPWRMKRTEPALRCIPDAAKVASLLSDAAETRVAEPVITRAAPASAMAAE